MNRPVLSRDNYKENSVARLIIEKCVALGYQHQWKESHEETFRVETQFTHGEYQTYLNFLSRMRFDSPALVVAIEPAAPIDPAAPVLAIEDHRLTKLHIVTAVLLACYLVRCNMEGC